jgi:hypothetical protein
MFSRKSGSQQTFRWRGQSRANPSLKPNSLLAGKMQGISSIRSSTARQREPKRSSNQCLTGQFPTPPNREFFAALQGIKSGDQGDFPVIRESALVHHFGICLADKCDRPDRPRTSPRRRRGRRQMLEAAEADLALEACFCPCERRARHSRKFGRRTRRREQTAFWASRWRRRSCRAPPDAPSSTEAAGPRVRTPLDMLMTLQGVYEKLLGTLPPSLRERHGGRASGNGRARSIGA